MVAELSSTERHNRKIRDWLLLVLRFAITRESTDRCSVLAAADELDAVGAGWRPAAPTFFLRTSVGICDAIATPHDDCGRAVLHTLLGRIDDVRLRQALRAAVDLPRPAARRRGIRPDLWKGLRPRVPVRAMRSR